MPGTKTARPLGVSGRNPVVEHSPGQDKCQDRHQCNPSPTSMPNRTGLGYLDAFRQSRQVRNHDFLCMTATPRNTATTPTTRLSQKSSCVSRPDWLCGSLASHIKLHSRTFPPAAKRLPRRPAAPTRPTSRSRGAWGCHSPDREHATLVGVGESTGGSGGDDEGVYKSEPSTLPETLIWTSPSSTVTRPHPPSASPPTQPP